MIVLVLVRAQTLSLKPSYSRIMLMVSLEVASLSSVRWIPTVSCGPTFSCSTSQYNVAEPMTFTGFHSCI